MLRVVCTLFIALIIRIITWFLLKFYVLGLYSRLLLFDFVCLYGRVLPVEEYCAVNYCGSLLHHDSNLLSYLMPSDFDFDLGA